MKPRPHIGFKQGLKCGVLHAVVDYGHAHAGVSVENLLASGCLGTKRSMKAPDAETQRLAQIARDVAALPQQVIDEVTELRAALFEMNLQRERIQKSLERADEDIRNVKARLAELPHARTTLAQRKALRQVKAWEHRHR